MYLLKDFYKNKNIFYIDVGNMGYYWGISCMQKDQIIDAEKYTHKLSNGSIAKWQKLKLENADLRLVINGCLKSYDYSYLDNKILKKLYGHNETLLMRLVADLISQKVCHIGYDAIFILRIKTMIKNKKILFRTETHVNKFGSVVHKQYICTI